MFCGSSFNFASISLTSPDAGVSVEGYFANFVDVCSIPRQVTAYDSWMTFFVMCALWASTAVLGNQGCREYTLQRVAFDSELFCEPTDIARWT